MIKEDKSKLIQNILLLFSIQGLQYILPLITLPYLFRVLGADKYGLVAFALSTVIFINAFVSFGYELSASRDIAINQNDKKSLTKIFSTTLTVKAILVLIGFLFMNIFILFVEKTHDEIILFYFSFLFVVGNAITPVWFFLGLEKIKHLSYLSIIVKVISTIMIFFTINSPSDYIYQPLIVGGSLIFIGIYSLFYIYFKFEISYEIQTISDLIGSVKKSKDIFITEIVPSMYDNFISFLLAFFTTMDNVGYFAIARQLIGVFEGFMRVFRNVTFPYLNKNFSKFNIITKTTLLLSVAVSIGVYLFAYPFVTILFGYEALKSVEIVYILGIAPVLLAIRATYGVNYLLVLKQDAVYTKITLIYSISGIVFALVLIPSYSTIGAAIALLGSWMIMAWLLYTKSRSLAANL